MIARIYKQIRELRARSVARRTRRAAELAAHRVVTHRLAPIVFLVLSGCSYALPILCVDRMPEDTQGVKCGVLRSGTFSGTVVCVPDSTEPWVCESKDAKGDCAVWAPKSIADAKAAGQSVANPSIEVISPRAAQDAGLGVTP